MGSESYPYSMGQTETPHHGDNPYQEWDQGTLELELGVLMGVFSGVTQPKFKG